MSRTPKTSAGFLALPSNPRPALRLICVPYAGGGVSVFHKWPASLPPEVQVCAAQLAGRDSRFGIPPFRRVEALVEVLVDAMDPFLDLPFALFGHSMGGLIIFELARALRARRDVAPVHFFVSGCRAASRPRRPNRMYELPDDDFVRELRARYDGIPDVVASDPDLLRMFVSILKADMELVETYEDRGGERFSFPITALGGEEDRAASKEDLEAWQTQTTGDFKLHMFPGSHFFINTAQAAVLRTLNQELTSLIIRSY